MANTACKGCLFSKPNLPIEESCEFDIPYHVKDVKNVSLVNGHVYIDNYKCKYAFSEKILKDNDLNKEEVKNALIRNSYIAYYLIVDARCVTNDEQFEKLGRDINTLDIKPKTLSIIVDIKNTDNKNIYKTLYNTIDKEIKWKLHAFLANISFNKAANVVAETNIQTSNSSLIYFWDASVSDIIKINNRIEQVFFVRNVQQNNTFGFRSSEFDGLCMSISLYKSIITQVDRDILNALRIEKIDLTTYE